MKKAIYHFGNVKVTVIDKDVPKNRKEKLKQPLLNYYYDKEKERSLNGDKNPSRTIYEK